jgi:hypothetical protein
MAERRGLAVPLVAAWLTVRLLATWHCARCHACCHFLEMGFFFENGALP